MYNKLKASNKFSTFAKSNKIILLEGYQGWNKKVKIKAECGHEISSFPANIKSLVKKYGYYKCPKCTEKERKLSIEEMSSYISEATQKEYKLKSSKDWKTSRESKLIIYHKTCDQDFPITFSNFKLGRRCPHCAAKSAESKAAQLLKRLLEHHNINYISEKKFENLRNPFTGKKLRYDIFIPELNLVIEIDGEQHVIPIERFGGLEALHKNKYRDFLKNKYVMNNSLKMFRIPLYDKKLKKKKPYEELKKDIFNLFEYIIKELR